MTIGLISAGCIFGGADRAGAERTPDAVPRGASLLAHDAAPEFWPVRTAQCDRDHRAAHQRVVCVGRDLYYPGDEPPVARHDQSFQRADAQGPGTSRPIGKWCRAEFEQEVTEKISFISVLSVCSC